MNRSDFLRLSALGTLGLATRSFALPAGYTGIPAGIRPYLQTPRPDSMWVSWFSDNAPTGHIEWGTSPGSLTNTITAALDVLGTGFHYHAGRITGLSPNTYYYYRVRNGGTSSEVFRFRTPVPAGTKSGRMRVLVMGDNQIIGENRYEKLIACCKAKIEADFGKPIEEVIDFILMPGDQVDVGTLEHYRNLHFKQCGLISPNIPIMTTVGNHETYYDTSLSLYGRIFRYDDISYAGLPGPEGEKYYAYQLANVAFIHSSSEHTGATQKQWLRSLVDALKTDATTDLCVSVVHRPYQAEQYVGDISGWFRSEIMPMLAETEKHVLNIGAHHHLYARGQTREWPIYHIISGGTAWDQYWGQSSEIDFDDVQKTVAHWAWQLMDFDLEAKSMQVTCYAEANVKLPAATRWNYNSRVIDSFHRKLGLAAPAKPSLTNSFSTPVTLPLELVSAAYQSTTGEAINSTWFQIAADTGFTNLKFDRIRDVENLYGDTGAPLYEPVNIHAGVDILRFAVSAGLYNGSYYARVRHRDANAMWSPWSDAVTFTIEGSVGGPPAIKLGKGVYPPNEDISVVYENGPGLTQDWIGIYKKGEKPGSGNGAVGATTWAYVNAGNRINGSLVFTTNLPVGEWFAAFFTNNGYTEIAPRVPFYVGNEVVITPSEEAYDEGEAVRIDYTNAPAGTKDWIGIYGAGTLPGPASTPGTSTSVQYKYATTAAGFLEFTGLPKGYYFASFFVNDGYQEISKRIRFSVGTMITQVSMESAEITSGSDFTVNFSKGPGIQKDWIGIFKQGDVPGVDVLTSYLYFAGATAGSVTFQLPNLPPGDYFAAMFTNDSYTEVSNRYLFTVLPKEELKMESCSMEGDQMRFRWQTKSGKSYTIQKSTGLNAWDDVKTIVANGPSHEELIPIDRITQPNCFFRVID